jgi:drug/metabolite transporter (DMT)-like permease
MCGWAALAMLVRTLMLPTGFHIPVKVYPVAIACGICAAVAYFAYQTSITIGKVTVGWLMMNLSAGVPSVVSIWVYHEKLTAMKIFAFGLGLVSVLCLFQGQRIDTLQAAKTEKE